MNVSQILENLRDQGLEVSLENGNLRVRATRAKITEEQLSLLKGYKELLVVHLSQETGGRNGNSPLTESASTTEPTSCDEASPEESKGFKEYKLPNGETLRLTREEFDRVVDLFRLLHRQSLKNGHKKDVA